MLDSWRKPPHAERLALLLIVGGGLLLRLWGLGYWEDAGMTRPLLP